MAARWFTGPLASIALGLVLSIATPIASQNSGRPAPLTPDDVARAMQSRDLGKDSRGEMRMRLYDRQGRARERALSISSLRASGNSDDKTLIRFTYPNDIRGTSFLVWEHADADDERFLFLPALGRVRRIAGQEKQESFVGSDLSYEDIGGNDVADYTYAFVSESAVWTAPDGAKLPAWALESRARDAGAQYPRSVALVLKDRFILVHADIFNRRDERTKTIDVTRLERVDGIWTAMDLVVANARDKTRTELRTTSLHYNVGLKPGDFDRRQLEQGAR